VFPSKRGFDLSVGCDGCGSGNDVLLDHHIQGFVGFGCSPHLLTEEHRGRAPYVPSCLGHTAGIETGVDGSLVLMNPWVGMISASSIPLGKQTRQHPRVERWIPSIRPGALFSAVHSPASLSPSTCMLDLRDVTMIRSWGGISSSSPLSSDQSIQENVTITPIVPPPPSRP
jgi:hypothetical protein